MKTIILRRWATVALLTCAPALTLAQTLEQVLQQHFEAVGIERLKTKQQATIAMRSATGQGEAPGTLWLKRPNQQRREMQIMGSNITMLCFDGQKGWRTGMAFGGGGGGPQDLRAEEIERLKLTSMEIELGSPLYAATERGLTLSLKGKEELDGTEVFVVVSKNAKGEERSYYIDAEAGVLLMAKGKTIIRMMGNEQEVEVTERWSDYQSIGGVTIAMTRGRASSGASFGGGMGGGGNVITRYEKVDFDTPIDPSRFAK